MSDKRFFDTNILVYSRDLTEPNKHQVAERIVRDALIIAAALRSGSPVLCSEDLNHGRVYHGVEVVNPFADQAGTISP
jgi:predicted nucleic acid-binding protein